MAVSHWTESIKVPAARRSRSGRFGLSRCVPCDPTDLTEGTERASEHPQGSRLELQSFEFNAPTVTAQVSEVAGLSKIDGAGAL